MYLRNVAPEYLDGVEVRFAALPTELRSGDGIDRFQVTGPREVTIYRVPLERLEKLHCEDPVHVRALAEMTVLAAIGELHGREPWNIAHDRYNG